MIAKRDSSVIVEYLHRKAVLQGIPLSGTFELTPICNMSCNMCYVRQTPEQVQESGKRLRTVDEWLKLARDLKDQGTLMLLLTGGEPLTYPGFRELYSELRNMGFVVSINTNGTLIDEETVEWLSNNPPHRINITLYGASDSTYKRLCHISGGYTRTKRAIELLQDRGINVKLNCSVTPDNVDDLEDIIVYSDERKLILQATSYMFPPLRRDIDSVGKNARFSPEECAYTEAKIRLLQRGTDAVKQYGDAAERLQITEDSCFDCEGDRLRCRAGRSAFWITWDGRLLLCAMMDDPAYKPFEVGFATAWDKLREDTVKIRLPAECSACEAKDFCRSCAAMVYTETGSYDSKPQYRCDLIRAIPEACQKVLKEENSNEYRTGK